MNSAIIDVRYSHQPAAVVRAFKCDGCSARIWPRELYDRHRLLCGRLRDGQKICENCGNIFDKFGGAYAICQKCRTPSMSAAHQARRQRKAAAARRK